MTEWRLCTTYGKDGLTGKNRSLHHSSKICGVVVAYYVVKAFTVYQMFSLWHAALALDSHGSVSGRMPFDGPWYVCTIMTSHP